MNTRHVVTAWNGICTCTATLHALIGAKSKTLYNNRTR